MFLVLEGRIQCDLRAVQGTQDYEAWAVTLLNKSKLIDHTETRQTFMAYARHLHVSSKYYRFCNIVMFIVFKRKGLLVFDIPR